MAADAAGLAEPDIVVFVSANAVRHGAALAPPRSALAAIGSATAAALAAGGREATIVPGSGSDSEALLAEPALHEVRGKRVRIVRGGGGRALLGDTLASRGANVDYVEVYERRRRQVAADELAALDARFAAGEVHYVVAMSVASFDCLLELLPPAARRALPSLRLVTPSSRVIQTAQSRIPGIDARQAAGPRPEDLVATLLAWAADGRAHG